MSLASQISLLATAIGAKIKIAAPITRHKIEAFGLLPAASSSAQGQIINPVYYFGIVTYGTDGATLVPSTSTWTLDGHWSGTYSLVIYYGKVNNTGIVKFEISKNGGTSYTTLASGLDTYASATVPASATYTAIAIPEGSDVRFKVTVTGKNASSTQYFYTVSGYEMLRTGA